VSDDDNVYLNPSVVRQVINDIQEKLREERRKVTCRVCDFSFIPSEEELRCPRCKSNQD
jgi:Zn finger protein HypA/HybF involved in hydrogenase expression